MVFSTSCFCLHLDQWFLVVSTQLIGFSAGGIARRFLVVPASMIWPSTLVTCALFNTLHSQQYAGSGRMGGMSRERFFLYAFAASYLWCKSIILPMCWPSEMTLNRCYADFVPGYLCTSLAWKFGLLVRELINSLWLVQGLSYFSWVTWIWPENAGESTELFRLVDHSNWLGSRCTIVWVCRVYFL